MFILKNHIFSINNYFVYETLSQSVAGEFI